MSCSKCYTFHKCVKHAECLTKDYRIKILECVDCTQLFTAAESEYPIPIIKII